MGCPIYSLGKRLVFLRCSNGLHLHNLVSFSLDVRGKAGHETVVMCGNSPITRKSSCVNARGIPPVMWQVFTVLLCPPGGGDLPWMRGIYPGQGGYLPWMWGGVPTLDGGGYLPKTGTPPPPIRWKVGTPQLAGM